MVNCVDGQLPEGGSREARRTGFERGRGLQPPLKRGLRAGKPAEAGWGAKKWAGAGPAAGRGWIGVGVPGRGDGTCVPGSLRSLDAPLERRGRGFWGLSGGVAQSGSDAPATYFRALRAVLKGSVEGGREVLGRVGIGVFGTPQWERVWPGRFRSAVGGRGGGRGRARPERFVAGRLLVVLAGVGVAGGCRAGAGVCRREGEGVMWWSEA